MDDILITGSDSHLVASLIAQLNASFLLGDLAWSHALLYGHIGCSLIGLSSSFSNEAAKVEYKVK